ncbi:hypothetical protein N665_0834s0008 [Sinapis alba]|nr:hypothetical protein N665_0834s0008 [Sinapis alba]
MGVNYNKEMRNSIEMIFVDKEAKVVHLFKVNDVGGDYRTSTHRFKINFFQTTIIFEAGDFPSEVPEKYFADYNDIISGKLVKTYLVDIIGQIVNFGALENIIIKGKDNTKLIIELRDQNLPNDSLVLTNNNSSQWSVGTATSTRARFLVLNQKLTIGQIIDSTEVGTFVTMATIEYIDSEHGWQYLSCKHHNRKVMPTVNVDDDGQPLFYCNTCDKEHINVMSSIFLLTLLSYDDSGEANLLLFDTNAELIVHRSAAELYDEILYPESLPEAICDLFGKRILFEISVDSDNIKGKSSQYVVRLANDDREMIEEFAALPPKPVLMLQSSDEISDGSGGSSGTPLAKRKSQEDQDNDVEDQLSVNKKHFLKKLKGE